MTCKLSDFGMSVLLPVVGCPTETGEYLKVYAATPQRELTAALHGRNPVHHSKGNAMYSHAWKP
jgi:hypothetical protein